MEEDERDGGGHLDQAPRNEETPRVVGVDEPPDPASEQDLRRDACGQHQADLVGAGAVRLQPEGDCHERYSVAERRDHAAHEGDEEVAASVVDLQHLLNSIC